MILEALFLWLACRWVEKNTTPEERAKLEHESRSRAAKKGWETRRRNEIWNAKWEEKHKKK